MSPSDTCTDPVEARLCCECTTSAWLKAEIQRSGETATCAFCNHAAPSLSLSTVAGFVGRAFEEHFDRTPEKPSDWEERMLAETDRCWIRPGEETLGVVQDLAGVDLDAAEALRAILADLHYDQGEAALGNESPYAKKARYARKPANDLRVSSQWRLLESKLKHARRFFAPTAKATLDFVFGDLSSHIASDGSPVVTVAGPGQPINHLYRGRPIIRDDDLERVLARPELELGAPPPELARANRMNPCGVAALYGARSAAVCLSELRQPVGRELIVARFDIVRPLRLLIVDSLAAVKTFKECLDPGHLEECQRVEFFKRLSGRITQPVMPDDEPLEYLITQVVAEYLAEHHQLDGMVYHSVQADEPRANIVLFPNATLVEPVAWPINMKIDIQPCYSADDDELQSLMVIRQAGDDQPAAPPARTSAGVPTLRLVPNSIQVHRIKAVACPSTQTPVENWLPTPGKENHFTPWC